MESLKTLFFGALPPKEEILVYNLILGVDAVFQNLNKEHSICPSSDGPAGEQDSACTLYHSLSCPLQQGDDDTTA